MYSIESVAYYFLKFERKFGENLECQDIKGNCIFPHFKLFKASIDILSIHD
jgi:hypothetical protein